MKYDPQHFEAALVKHAKSAVRDDTVYYHGSPSGEFRANPLGIHIGTQEAARQALNARIGIKADGTDWDGKTEYGKTLIAGRQTLKQLEQSTGKFLSTGYNASPPDEDYYPTDARAYKVTYGDGTLIPMTVKPRYFKVRIVGGMKNTRGAPVSDNFANSKRRSMLMGYYYSNIGEDTGSISAVVPSGEWLVFV